MYGASLAMMDRQQQTAMMARQRQTAMMARQRQTTIMAIQRQTGMMARQRQAAMTARQQQTGNNSTNIHRTGIHLMRELRGNTSHTLYIYLAYHQKFWEVALTK